VRRSDPRIELHIFVEIEFLREVLAVSKSFFLRSKVLRPIPFIEQRLIE
jgi:hypothetical protein